MAASLRSKCLLPATTLGLRGSGHGTVTEPVKLSWEMFSLSLQFCLFRAAVHCCSSWVGTFELGLIPSDPPPDGLFLPSHSSLWRSPSVRTSCYWLLNSPNTPTPSGNAMSSSPAAVGQPPLPISSEAAQECDRCLPDERTRTV